MCGPCEEKSANAGQTARNDAPFRGAWNDLPPERFPVDDMKQLHRRHRISRLSQQGHRHNEPGFPVATPVLAHRRAAVRSLWACGRIAAPRHSRANRSMTGTAITGTGARFLALLLMLLIAETPSLRAAETAASDESTSAKSDAAKPKAEAVHGAPINLPLGKLRWLSLPPKASFRIIEGAKFVDAAIVDGALQLSPKRVGRAVVVVEAPDHTPQNYIVRVVLASARAQSSVDVQKPGISVAAAAQTDASTSITTPAPSTAGTTAGANAGGAPFTVLPAQANPLPTNPITPGDPIVVTPQNNGGQANGGQNGGGQTTTMGVAPTTGATSIFTIPAPSNVIPAPQLPTINSGVSPAFPSGGDGDQVSPILPAPSRALPGAVPYPTTSKPTLRNAPRPKGRNLVTVTQGLGRFFTFSNNILGVSFSDANVMSALPINARTLAITGLAPGVAQLGVFTERYPGDTTGRSHVYMISVTPAASAGGRPFAPTGDANGVRASIRAALNDPRIDVSMISLPGGSLTARLTGGVRDKAESDAAVATAGLFVRNVVSGLYVDPNASTQAAALTREAEVAAPRENPFVGQLRSVTGNNSIELLPLPNGSLALKAYVDSAMEADAIINLLPTLGRPVTPFIVIRGGAGTAQSIVTQPILSGEDAEITRRLQSVTGLNSVYAIKTSADILKPSEFGIAIYGTVRSRAEYDRLRRYSVLLTQTGGVSGGVGPPGTINQALPSTLAASGYRKSVGVQLFVRILDNSQNVIRRVTVQSNVVEINRTSLRNLGLEFGSASVLTENVIPGNPGTVVNSPGGVQTISGATPTIVQRTLNPTANIGSFLGGNGFGGGGVLQNIDPFRVRLNALYTRGNARVLSNPNLTATDGAVAQVLIGGNRPVPQGGVTQGAAVQSVTFRRFGISLTMRPTFTDDDTIILQIRADITNVDPTFSINLGGSLVPGESTRSIDNTLTVRDGDIIVMAGLITNERRQLTSRIPILSSIPIFGKLFRSKRFENNETELAIFLTPRVSRTPASSGTISDVESIPALPPLPNAQANSGLVVFGGQGQ